MQPSFGCILGLGKFASSIENRATQISRSATRGQFLRKTLGEIVGKIDMLDAALLQQSRARAALRRTRNFAPVDKHVGANRIRET